MFDFRLKVFYTVAQRLSFTKAADELFISQPAVSKHIKEIEKHYQCRLFERSGNLLKLTSKGEILKDYASRIINLYNELDTEITSSNTKFHGYVRAGASTTAAQYVLPDYLARFRTAYPRIFIELKTGNTEEIEKLLLKNKIDVGIVEGKTKRSHLIYTPFKKDEIVLCTRTGNRTKPAMPLSNLKNLNYVTREKGSGTLEIIRSALLKNKIKLDDLSIEIVLENNESIKSYLRSSDTYAFISIAAITDELISGRLKIIDVENLSMERFYYIVSRQGEQTETVNVFKSYLLKHNF